MLTAAGGSCGHGWGALAWHAACRDGGMVNNTKTLKPWLIAAWPGMGNVAVVAAGYLVQQLQMEPAGELASPDHFDVQHVEVRRGMIAPPRLPRGLFFRWKNPGPGRDLIVFLGEAQPGAGTYGYAHELLGRAVEMGAERMVTFASMSTALHPTGDPRVFGAATGETTLADLKRAEVQPLEEGQIGGLNGVLLGAGIDCGVPGLCLLGEIPFYAGGVPNPKAARAVLSVFSVIAGIDISLDGLAPHIAAMDRVLLEILEKAKHAAEQQREGQDPDEESELKPERAPERDEAAAESSEDEGPGQPGPDYTTRERIERMFEEARRDRSKAMPLKEELDRLTVFKQYEDRFLDLFKRAG
jgi:proteasome assembly chaperone (PAC2) family protein